MTEPVGTVDTEPRPPEETPDGAESAGPPDATTPMPRDARPRRTGSVRRFLRRSGGVGLRRRILLTFTLGSLTLSAFLAVTTYGLVRSNLIEQRYITNRQAAYSHAQFVQRGLSSGPSTLSSTSEQLQQIGAQRPVIYYNGQWSVGVSRFGNQELPPGLVSKVLTENVPARMIADVGGKTVMVFGIPLPDLGAYF